MKKNNRLSQLIARYFILLISFLCIFSLVGGEKVLARTTKHHSYKKKHHTSLPVKNSSIYNRRPSDRGPYDPIITQIQKGGYQLYLLINGKPFTYDGQLRPVSREEITSTGNGITSPELNYEQIAKVIRFVHKNVNSYKLYLKRYGKVFYYNSMNSEFGDSARIDERGNLSRLDPNSFQLVLLSPNDYVEHFGRNSTDNSNFSDRISGNEVTKENSELNTNSEKNSSDTDYSNEHRRLAIRPNVTIGADYTTIKFLQYENSVGGNVTSNLSYHGNLGFDFRVRPSSIFDVWLNFYWHQLNWPDSMSRRTFINHQTNLYNVGLNPVFWVHKYRTRIGLEFRYGSEAYLYFRDTTSMQLDSANTLKIIPNIEGFIAETRLVDVRFGVSGIFMPPTSVNNYKTKFAYGGKVWSGVEKKLGTGGVTVSSQLYYQWIRKNTVFYEQTYKETGLTAYLYWRFPK